MSTMSKEFKSWSGKLCFWKERYTHDDYWKSSVAMSVEQSSRDMHHWYRRLNSSFWKWTSLGWILQRFRWSIVYATSYYLVIRSISIRYPTLRNKLLVRRSTVCSPKQSTISNIHDIRRHSSSIGNQILWNSPRCWFPFSPWRSFSRGSALSDQTDCDQFPSTRFRCGSHHFQWSMEEQCLLKKS